MMRDGKALQMGTSHELGQNFAKAFDIKFLDESGQQVFVWQTSWGASSRLMGALIMAHGDDAGLRVPPRSGPRPGRRAGRADRGRRRRGGRGSWPRRCRRRATGRNWTCARRVSFGRRVVGWELKGVPVRVEVGPRDLAAGTVVLCRRDDATKAPVRLDEVVEEVRKVLEAAQASLLAEARAMRSARTVEVSRLEEVEEATQSGFALLPGSLLTSGDGQGEQRLNAAGVSVRALHRPDGSLPTPDEDVAGLVAVVARAY